MEACYKAANDVYADLSKSNPMFKKMYDSLVPFRNDSYLWTGRGDGLRQFHGPHAHPELRPRRRSTNRLHPPRRFASGVFYCAEMLAC